MTILNTENKQDEVLAQEPKEVISQQEQISSNVTQNSKESLGEEPKEDVNWRAFREARKKDRAEREAAEKRAAEKEAEASALRAAMEAAFSKSSPTPSAYQQYYGMQPENDILPTDQGYDSVIEKKVEALLHAKEEKFRQEQAERERRELPNRLTRELPGFTEVCSQENIDYLDYHYPEIARPLGRLNDGYEKWHDIYYAVKKFVPNHDSAKKDSIRADQNLMKPKSMNSVGMTNSGQKSTESWKDVEARRAANYERMQRIIKGGA